jgi:hypothetical protein
MIETSPRLSPEDLEALLPWYAAGALNSRTANEIDKALARDQELARRFRLVREEMTETILLNEALGAPSARASASLFEAIDKDLKQVRSPATSSRFSAWLADLSTPRFLAPLASAAGVIIMLQAGVIAKIVLQAQSGGSFETASAPSTATLGKVMGSYALVRFTPQASIEDITGFLDRHGALIVDGPRPSGPGGMYRIRVAPYHLAKDDLDRVVEEFQSASNLISFAMPTE